MYAISRYIVVTVLLALPASLGLAQSPPLEVKGIQLGASMDDLRTAMPEAKCYSSGCFVNPEDRSKATCGERPMTYGDGNAVSAYVNCKTQAASELNFGPAVVDQYYFQFSDGHLAFVDVKFNTAFHRRVVIALTEKYGAPTEDKNAPLQNRMGATFENNIVIWRRSDGQIEATERGARLDEGHVKMSTAAYIANTAREIIEQAKASAKKL